MCKPSLPRCLKLFVQLLLFQVATFSGPLLAADWQSLVQPLGTENTPFLYQPSLLNASYDPGKGPWESGTMVTSIRTTVPQFFVRFYNPSASLNPSGQEGGWVMRASTVRGLTAGQVRELFALPNIPTMMTLGLSTPGESFYTGVAAPIDGWGEGGGQQSQSSGGPYTTFFNAQALTSSVLYYPSMAGSENNRSIGAYLVAHQPEPYSDMELVYNSLDVLCNPASSDLFNSALASIAPARFDDIATLGTRALILQNQAINDRIDMLMLSDAASGFWVRGVKSSSRRSSEGFYGDLYGILAGGDAKLGASMRSGITFGWMHGTLDWLDGGGGARVGYCRLSAYTSVVVDNAFIQLHAGAGSTRGETTRNISVPTFYQRSAHGPADSPLSALSRVAGGSYGGWDADVDIRTGAVVHAGALKILPSAALGYLYQSRGGFTETGAGSLNLSVAPAQSRTLLCSAGLRIDREITLESRRTFTPYLSIRWMNTRRLDGRSVSASLNGWNDSFVTTLSRRDTRFLEGAAGIGMNVGNHLSINAACSYIGHGDGALALGLGYGL
ncbi:MAG: autotransporter outer membrane beta-barrel domain-containing protein [Chlorobiaceae bacterium]|nr:autotransporter outer membrane beta-barrel domain-containing protein [Chlorobiaceae bacterium]